MAGKNLSIHNTASGLGISEAMVRNWIKHNFLTPVFENNNICFDNNEVLKLKEKKDKGEIERLNKRANKRKGDKYLFI